MKSQWQFVRRLGEPRAAMACPRGGVGGGPRPGGRARCGKSPAALPGPVAPPRASAHRPRRGPWVGRCHGKLSRAAAGGGSRGCSGGRAIGLPAAGGLGRGPIGLRWAAADLPRVSPGRRRPPGHNHALEAPVAPCGPRWKKFLAEALAAASPGPALPGGPFSPVSHHPKPGPGENRGGAAWARAGGLPPHTAFGARLGLGGGNVFHHGPTGRHS
jgi:hypothetical protein